MEVVYALNILTKKDYNTPNEGKKEEFKSVRDTDQATVFLYKHIRNWAYIDNAI